MKKHQKKTEEPASGYKYLQQIVSSVSPPLLTTAQLQGQKITINPNVHDDRHGVVWEDDFGETEEQNKPKKRSIFFFGTLMFYFQMMNIYTAAHSDHSSLQEGVNSLNN